MICKTTVSCPSDENDKPVSPDAVFAWRLANLSEDFVHALWNLYEKEFLDLYNDEMLNEMLENEYLDRMADQQDLGNKNA